MKKALVLSLLVFAPLFGLADDAHLFARDVPKNMDELKRLEQKVKEVIRKSQAYTVDIGGGSGVVVSSNGLVLTVAHVASRPGRNVTITFPDGRKAQGKTLGCFRDADAALVQITGEGKWPYAEMGDSDEVKPGQWCIAMGYPVSFEAGQPPAVRVGRVLHTWEDSVMTDCVIMGGDSGGPIYDLEGRVIGISSRCDGVLHRNFHVPIDVFHDHWDRLVGGDAWSSDDYAFLGVGPADASGAAKLGRIIEGTAAEVAELKVGDLVLEFGGDKVENYPALVGLIRKREPGDEVEMKIKRNDEAIIVKVKLTRRGDH